MTNVDVRPEPRIVVEVEDPQDFIEQASEAERNLGLLLARSAHVELSLPFGRAKDFAKDILSSLSLAEPSRGQGKEGVIDLREAEPLERLTLTEGLHVRWEPGENSAFLVEIDDPQRFIKRLESRRANPVERAVSWLLVHDSQHFRPAPPWEPLSHEGWVVNAFSRALSPRSATSGPTRGSGETLVDLEGVVPNHLKLKMGLQLRLENADRTDMADDARENSRAMESSEEQGWEIGPRQFHDDLLEPAEFAPWMNVWLRRRIAKRHRRTAEAVSEAT